MTMDGAMVPSSLALPLLLGVLGACVGSFLNVVIYRLPRRDPELGGLSISKPVRSFCPKCKRQIAWYDNVPIVSWIALGGKCRGCKSEISARYLLVEVLTALLFGAWTSVALRHAAQRSGPFGFEDASVVFAGLLLVAACVAVTFVDMDWRIIPDEITWPGMVVGVLLSIAAPPLQEPSWLFAKLAERLHWERHVAAAGSSFGGVVAGAGVLWLVGVVGKAVFKPKDMETGEATDAMGFGDVKYMGLAGAFLGADGVLLVFLIGCVLGAVGGLVHFAVKRDRFVPFGPFLSLGLLIVLFFRDEVVDFLLVTWPGFVQGLFHSSS
jgi:leader peptidase (prepilin peptidase)/N-methyltransferase